MMISTPSIASRNQSEWRPSRIPVSSRLNSFAARPELFDWIYGVRDPRDMLRRVECAERLEYVSLNFPEHFPSFVFDEMARAARSSRLKVSSINLRYPAEFALGAFTHPDAGMRQKAVDLTLHAVDLCAHLGGSDAVIWPGPDGFDYPFQMDYARAWDWELEGIARVADHAAGMGVRISIEYKPCEPRKFCLLGNFGLTMAALMELDRPNVGVTCDLCHMLIAREAPAESIALALRSGKLFGIHLNDGYGMEDDGLAIGSVHFFQTLEVVSLLCQYEYGGFIYFDTFPTNEDPVRECSVNLDRLELLFQLAERVCGDHLKAFTRAQDGLGANQHLWDTLFREMGDQS